MSYYYDVCHKLGRHRNSQKLLSFLLNTLLKVSPTILMTCVEGFGTMKMRRDIMMLRAGHEEASIVDILETVKENCEYCRPSTPITCVKCGIWKQKKKLRELHEKLRDPNFVKDLLNTLKNRRRLQLLEILSKGRSSVVRLQRKLTKLGYHHSQGTIAQEYIAPLIEIGIADVDQNRYQATLFGLQLNGLIQGFRAIIEHLPPHSKCYEEKVIESLSRSPKTHEELKTTIAIESLSRILKRLQEADLVTKDQQDSYIFHFKTKRDPKKEKLSPTETRVYQNIPEEGISAQELADKTNISLRRTYKYLRRLRGKKLAFKRKRPKKYKLTEQGMTIAELLEKIQALLIEFTQALQQFSRKPYEVAEEKMVPDTSKARRENIPQILAKPKA